MAASITSPDSWSSTSLSYSIDPSIESARSAIEAALDAWANVAPFSFIEVSPGFADIDYGPKTGSGAYEGRATTYFTEGRVTSVDVELNQDTYALALHETGHALAQITDSQPFLYLYETLYNGGLGGVDNVDTLPGGADIQAIQEKYGASPNANLIHAGEGGHVISGGDGVDTIFGEGGNDILYGNKEVDFLDGGAGDDVLYGGQNNGPVSTGDGTASDGVLRQRDGEETLSGGDGSDVIYGNYGSDRLYGDSGNDRLYGGQDIDRLFGGDGDDSLFGNKGDDELTGGSGSDLFSTAGGGADRVMDFNGAEGDRIDVQDPNAVSIADSGGGLVLTHSSGSVTLVGVQAGSFDTGWLI